MKRFSSISQPLRSRCGFSLVEAVLSIGVMSFGFLALAPLLAVGMNGARGARENRVSAQIATTLAGLCLSAGLLTRFAAGAFAILLAYLALADRLEAFTVSKLGPMIALALWLSPCGARYGVDAWLRRRRHPEAAPPTHVAGGVIRYFQIFLAAMYSGAGIAKLRGDWLSGDVLWSHLHDNYPPR